MKDERTGEAALTAEQIDQFEEMKKKAEKHFYFLIGASITAWSSMEGYLVHIATLLLDTAPPKAGLVLYSTNFHNWLSIVRDLLNIDPNYHSLRSDWNKMRKG